MEDRREWIAARAAEISADLGYPSPPLIEFEKSELLGPVAFKLHERVGRKKYQPVATPLLQIDPAELESLSERELIYRLTLTLVMHAPGRIDKGLPICLPICMTPPAITFLAVLYLAYRFGPVWLLALPAPFLVIYLSMPLLYPIILLAMDAQLLRDHLEAIEKTADAVTALNFLTTTTAERPRWMPASIWNRMTGKDNRLAANVRREAEKRGYRTHAIVDA